MVKFLPKKTFNYLKKYYLWIIGVIFISLLFLNIFIYYQYIYLVMKNQPELINQEININEEVLQKVRENIDKREENLFRVRKTEYYNPFND